VSGIGRAAKYQGTVLLYIEIDPNGNATNIKVQRSLGLGLDEKAVEAVSKWKFKPGMKDGAPVTVAATIEVNFRL
jgi:protein TonB